MSTHYLFFHRLFVLRLGGLGVIFGGRRQLMGGAAGVFCPLSANTKETERHRRALMKSSSAGFLLPVK